jgi:hypothetical protein
LVQRLDDRRLRVDAGAEDGEVVIGVGLHLGAEFDAHAELAQRVGTLGHLAGGGVVAHGHLGAVVLK